MKIRELSGNTVGKAAKLGKLAGVVAVVDDWQEFDAGDRRVVSIFLGGEDLRIIREKISFVHIVFDNTLGIRRIWRGATMIGCLYTTLRFFATMF